MCFLIAYLSPLQGEDPFNGIRRALGTDIQAGELPDLDAIPLGPRTSHDYTRGNRTLEAYLHWTQRAGSQVEPSPAITTGASRGASSGCSSGSRSPDWDAWGAMTCSSPSVASGCMS